MNKNSNFKIKNALKRVLMCLKQLDMVLAGFGLISLGAGFLVISYVLSEIHEYLILGGLLWFVLGSATLIINVIVDHERKKTVDMSLK